MPETPTTVLSEIFNRRQPLESEEAFRDWLGSLSAQFTGKRVAQAAGISPSRLSRIIHGRDSIGPGLAARFGYRRETRTVYRPAADSANAASSKERPCEP